MTPLDKALQAALSDQSKAGEFYNLFLRSDIYIPTHDKPEAAGAKRAGDDETFNPVILQNEGDNILLLFDTLDRLQTFAPRELSYIALPGHAILESMPEGIHWVLNHGTEYPKEFSLEELSFLKKQFEQDGPQSVKVSEDTQILIGTPAKVPDGLVDVLAEACRRNNEIVDAYLGQIYIEAPGEVPHLALVVTTAGAADPIKKAIITDLTAVVRGKLGEEGQIEMLVDRPGQMTDGIKQEVKPFYVSAGADASS
jgi:hypothetical protein